MSLVHSCHEKVVSNSFLLALTSITSLLYRRLVPSEWCGGMNSGLGWVELKLLMAINECCDGTNQVERDRLSVVARGRGIELGHALRRLQCLGFVEEFRQQPTFFRKSLGALPINIVMLTDRGRAVFREVENFSKRD